MSSEVTKIYEAPVGEVFAVLSGRDFWERKTGPASSGLPGGEILELGEKGGEWIIRVAREVPTVAPGVAKLFVGKTVQTVHTERWRKNADFWSGRFEVEVRDSPARVAGVARLTAAPVGTEYRVALAAQVDVPLLGRKIERRMEAEARTSLESDHYLILEFLARRATESRKAVAR